MKLNKKSFGVLLTAAVLSATAAHAVNDNPAPAKTNAPTATTKADELFPDPVIVKGKGIEIKRGQLDEAVASVKASEMSRGHDVTPAQMGLLEKQVLDRLIMNKLLNAKATDADKAKGKEEGDKRFEAIKKRGASEETLVKQLKSIGLTLDTLHTRLIEEAIPEAVLRSKVTVTDEQAKRYYDDHPADFEEPEMVRASHILLMTSDPKTGEPLTEAQKKAKHTQIEELLKRARAGEDFGKLAKEFTEDAGSKTNGGEYFFPRGQMVPDFEAAAFTLKTNQISDIVTTTYGYHIIKMTEKVPAKKVELAKVNGDVKDFLANSEIKKMLPDYYASLRREADVEIMDPKLKSMDDVDTTKPSPVTTKPPAK